MEKKLDFFLYRGVLWGKPGLVLRPYDAAGGLWCYYRLRQFDLSCSAPWKKSLYSGNLEKLDQDEYLYFTEEMKKYLHPRWSGIDKPELYVEGYQKFP